MQHLALRTLIKINLPHVSVVYGGSPQPLGPDKLQEPAWGFMALQPEKNSPNSCLSSLRLI